MTAYRVILPAGAFESGQRLRVGGALYIDEKLTTASVNPVIANADGEYPQLWTNVPAVDLTFLDDNGAPVQTLEGVSTHQVATINTSGFEPLDLRVLVLPDPIEERTSGGIILPDQKKERDKFAQQLGTLIAVGENAWEEASARSANFRKPLPGERVLFSRYGGVLIDGKDGREYRLMNDEDVVCRVSEG